MNAKGLNEIFPCAFMKKLEHGGMCNPGIWEAEPGGLPQIGGSPGRGKDLIVNLTQPRITWGKTQ